MDIRYIREGATVYLPCNVEGCGLAIGDFHYAQGDGEVSGTAIEMDADITVTTRVLSDGPNLKQGPHYEGPASMLAIPSSRFYATTGFPLKEKGAIPRDIEYLASGKIAALSNLSKDLNLAAANALVAMIDYIVGTYGYDRRRDGNIAAGYIYRPLASFVCLPDRRPVFERVGQHLLARSANFRSGKGFKVGRNRVGIEFRQHPIEDIRQLCIGQ
jgi:formamidase